MSAEHDEAMNRLQQNTAMSRFLPVLRNEIRNIRTLAGKRDATSIERIGGTMICAGAGPSLDAARPFLREARRLGVPVIAAAPAARALDWDVDVSVSVEAIGGSRAVPPPDSPVMSCVALCSGQDQWERADAWFTDYYPHNAELAKALGSKPLFYPGNVGPAVVGLALTWGADRVILVGFDLAYTGGKAYAEGAPWAATTLTDNDGALTFEHAPGRNESHAASGAATVPEKHDAVYLPAWGGEGEATTTYDYYAQIESLRFMAQSFGGDVELLNATGGGAHVDGFIDVMRERCEGAMVPGRAVKAEHMRKMGDYHVDAALAHLRAEQDRIHNAAVDELEYKGAHGAWRNWLLCGGFPFASAFCLADFTALSRQKLGVTPDAVKARYVVMRAVSDEMRETLA